jgi:hypothetical protein
MARHLFFGAAYVIEREENDNSEKMTTFADYHDNALVPYDIFLCAEDVSRKNRKTKEKTMNLKENMKN